MWIVRLALRRPYTFVVASLLLLLLTPFVLLRTPTDIFPSINIPVVSVIWQYTGLSAKEIEQRMVYTDERALTTTVNNIEHIESTSYDGVAVVKVFFHQGVSPDAGVAQITAESQSIRRQLPPGTPPPLIIQYNASTVPILQYGISSKTLSEQQTFDLALNTVRVGLISVPGVGIPYPFGGKQRVVSVDLDLKALERQNLAAQDVVNAISAQNLVYPIGTAKIGANEYPSDFNTMLTGDVQIKQFGDQSLFVKAAVSGVVREGVIAAALTAAMILLFLGSWRSTLIIAISIPLSVLTSLALLSAIGETINLMTLLSEIAGHNLRTSPVVRVALSRLLRLLVAAGSIPWTGLFSQRGRGHVSFACACPYWHSPRGDRSVSGSRRREHSP